MTEAGIDERPRTPSDEELPALLEELEAIHRQGRVAALDLELDSAPFEDQRQGVCPPWIGPLLVE